MSNNDSLLSKAGYPRRKPRYAAHLQVLVFTKGLNHFLSERTANISSGGLFVCTEHSAEVGEKLHIRVMLADIDSYFDVKTEVVWVCDGGSSHPQGLGLMFVDLSDDQQVVVDKILKNYINVKER
jgi:uncharacterized protein (TIGR02266 family)